MNQTTKVLLGLLVIAVITFLGITYLKAPASQSTVSTTLPAVSETDWKVGSASSSVTLIEYADFQCPACAAYAPIVEMLKKEYQGKVQFVFRTFPLAMHINAVPAALAAEAAGAQGKYFEFSEKLFTNQEKWADSKTPQDIFAVYAQELGLDMAKFKADSENQATKDKIVAGITSGVKAKVNSTPTFFLQGVKIQNPTGNTNQEAFDGFKKLIDAELAKVMSAKEMATTTAQ